jgi:hypothetical protein
VGAVTTTSNTTIKLRWGQEGGWSPLIRILLDDDAPYVIVVVVVVVVVAIRGIGDGIAVDRTRTMSGQTRRLVRSNRRVGRMTGMKAETTDGGQGGGGKGGGEESHRRGNANGRTSRGIKQRCCDDRRRASTSNLR